MDLRIAITGASGLIGSALSESLVSNGHTVLKVGRSADSDHIRWDPERGKIESEKFEGLDCVVHLAGHNIANGRWSTREKHKILDSRVVGTSLLCRTLGTLKSPPRTLISASAIGIYGDRGNEELSESSTLGDNFLAQVCKQWEASTQPAQSAGIRVAIPRFGVVLSTRGGALKKMLPPFWCGLGGRLGSGTQYVSWIAIDDVINAINHIISHSELQGIMNFSAPNPITNLHFTKALGAVLHRPTLLPVPATILRMALGALADEALLASTRALPLALRNSGYRFMLGDIESALAHLLRKNN